MAGANGTATNVRRKPRKLNYFYLDAAGRGPMLHRRLHINRGADQITTWCYPLHKRVAYTYSDVKKNMDPAFTTQEVAKMLNRRRETVERAILNGYVEEPQHAYTLDENKRKFKYMWHESNIMELHKHFSSMHKGRPRKDGLVTPQKLLTARELRALVRNQEILYIRTDDGEFRPVWDAEDML